MWKYFGFPLSYVDNICVVDKKDGSTTNMAGHLCRHHKNIDLSVKPTPVIPATLPSSYGIKNPESNRTMTLESKILSNRGFGNCDSLTR